MFEMLQALTTRQLETSQRLQTLEVQQAETATSLLNAQKAQINAQNVQKTETKDNISNLEGLQTAFAKTYISMLLTLQTINEFQNIKKRNNEIHRIVKNLRNLLQTEQRGEP
jgi:hypothetical protein